MYATPTSQLLYVDPITYHASACFCNPLGTHRRMSFFILRKLSNNHLENCNRRIGLKSRFWLSWAEYDKYMNIIWTSTKSWSCHIYFIYFHIYLIFLGPWARDRPFGPHFCAHVFAHYFHTLNECPYTCPEWGLGIAKQDKTYIYIYIYIYILYSKYIKN